MNRIFKKIITLTVLGTALVGMPAVQAANRSFAQQYVKTFLVTSALGAATFKLFGQDALFNTATYAGSNKALAATIGTAALLGALPYFKFANDAANGVTDAIWATPKTALKSAKSAVSAIGNAACVVGRTAKNAGAAVVSTGKGVAVAATSVPTAVVKGGLNAGKFVWNEFNKNYQLEAMKAKCPANVAWEKDFRPNGYLYGKLSTQDYAVDYTGAWHFTAAGSPVSIP